MKVLAQQTKVNEMVQYVRDQAAADHADTGLKLDLLRFWSKYPYARFTPAIVTRALDPSRKTDVSQALESFVKAHLLEKHVQQGLPFYCLTEEPSMRQWVLNMAAQEGSLRSSHRPFYS